MTVAPRPPADQEVRERITGEVDRSCLVEASAGTGKTRLLVERILTILRTGVCGLDRIAAITFTEKAAGELKTRLRSALESAWHAAASGSTERERYGSALRDLDRALVTTIHAFCSEILKSNPVEARVSPGFSVADADAQRLLLDEARESWKEEELEKPDSELGPVLQSGGQFHWLNELTRVLIENRDLLRDEARDLITGPVPDPEPSFRAFLDLIAPASLDDLEALLGACGKPATCRAWSKVSQALPGMRRAAARFGVDHSRAMHRALAGVTAPRIGNVGRKADWPDGRLGELRERMVTIDAAQTTFMTLHRSRAAVLAVRALNLLIEGYEQKKRERGQLDFQDLLIKARDVVRDHPAVRRRLRDTFSVLLVDEFQDTDPLQAEIVFLLCGADTEERDWRKARVDPGRLFLVGDPKQSIYRFRRADIQVYEQAKRTLLASGGTVLPITVNFRTRGGITDWVNRVFRRLMPPEEADAHHPAYSPLFAYREDVPGLLPPLIRLAVPKPPDGETNVVARRKMEAAAVARFLRDGIEGGTLFGSGAGGREPLEYGDVAVLFRMTTGLEIYEDEFREAGVPYRVEGGRYYFQRLEVQSLLAVLRAVDRPNDREALVAALRSPLFGFDDEELMIAAAEDSLHYGARRRTSNGDLARALDRMEVWHERRHMDSPAVIVEEILKVTRAIEFFSLQSLGAQRAANLLKVVDEAMAYGGEAGAFRVFVEHLSEREMNQEAEEESPISEEADRGFVRFLTVHKSKGLEFPVVILADPEAKPKATVEALVDRGSGRLAVQLKSLNGAPGQTPGWEELLELDKVMTAAEEKRLFYVAATRARDALVLPVRVDQGSSGFLGLLETGDLPPLYQAPSLEAPTSAASAPQLSLFAELAGAPPADSPGHVTFAPPADPAPVLRVLDPGASVAEARARFTRERDALLAALPRAPRIVAPSSLHRTEGVAAARRSFPVAAGSGRALELGSLVHRVLELVAPDGGDLAEKLKALAPHFPLLEAEDITTARRLAGNALDHPVWKRAMSSARVFRETPFLGMESETLFIDGFADLVFEEEGGLVVVDFKTDKRAGRDLETMAGPYRGQALGYALGVSRAAGRPVREVVLLFLDTGEQSTMAVNDTVLEEARRGTGLDSP